MWSPRAPSYLRPRRSWRAPGELLNFGLFFVCAVLLVMSRISHGIIIDARDWLVDLSAPVLEAASIPAIKGRQVLAHAKSYAGLFGEIDRLTAQNAELKQYEWRAKTAERKVAQLRSLLNAVDEPALHYVTGSVIADARGPFMRSALINLGREQGLRVGYAVINGDGLIGRTVDAGASVARVLLLNDLNSRIPVLVGPAGIRALAVGDNSAELQLELVADGAVLQAGDEVYTSGSDGVLPRGLRVGSVAGAKGAYKVRPHADLSALDTVSVLFFDTPALAATDPPAAAAQRPLSTTPETDSKTPEAGEANTGSGLMPGGTIQEAGAGAGTQAAESTQTQQ
jgi:rod shape-determining protein MreC